MLFPLLNGRGNYWWGHVYFDLHQMHSIPFQTVNFVMPDANQNTVSDLHFGWFESFICIFIHKFCVSGKNHLFSNFTSVESINFTCILYSIPTAAPNVFKYELKISCFVCDVFLAINFGLFHCPTKILKKYIVLKKIPKNHR